MSEVVHLFFRDRIKLWRNLLSLYEKGCPGFSWHGVDFLHSVWYDAMFLIAHQWHSCCWAVPYRAKAISVSQLCTLPCQWWVEGAQGAKRTQNQDSWPKMAKEIFHTVWHHMKKQYNWGELTMGTAAAFGDWLAIIWQVLSNCFVHQLFCVCVSIRVCVYNYNYCYFSLLFLS